MSAFPGSLASPPGAASAGILLPRLPVYFLLDCSAAMSGEFNVALNEGLQTARYILARDTLTVRQVYVSALSLGATVLPADKLPWIEPVWRHYPSAPEVGDEVYLAPALRGLNHMLSYGAIDRATNHPGDLQPLVFLVLGARPRDDPADLRAALDVLFRRDHVHRPYIVALERQSVFTSELQTFCPVVFRLRPAKAEALQTYFEWAAHMAFNFCAAYVSRTAVEAPPAPSYGIVQVV